MMLAVRGVTVAIAIAAGVLFARRRRKLIVRSPGFKAWRMSRFVVYGGRLETQGLCGDPSKSVGEQTAEALGKLDAILKEAQITRSHLLSTTIYLADIEDFDKMNEVYDAWIKDHDKPTRACVQAKLGHGCKVEIRANAASPSF